MSDVVTVYGLGFFVVAAICWGLFVRETRLPLHEFQEMEKPMQQVYGAVGFLLCVAVAALWPLALPCYVIALIVTPKRPEGPL